MSSWQTKSSRKVYENPWIIVKEDEVIMPNGKDGLFGVVSSKSDAVFVIPVDSQGNTYLVQQERYTTQELAWQVVAGRVDEGETEEAAAKRELLEEAGLEAQKVTLLSKARTAIGITTFRSTVLLAEDLIENTASFDASEIQAIKKLPLDSALDMIRTGEIATTESIAALFLAKDYLVHRLETAH